MKKVVRSQDTLGSRSTCLHFPDYVQKDSPVFIGDFLIRETLHSTPHFHDFFEFYFVREGRVVEYRPEKKHFVDKHSLVFVPPQAVHQFANGLPQGKTHFTNIAFSKTLFHELALFFKDSAIENAMTSGFTLTRLPSLFWEHLIQRTDLLRQGSGLDKKGRGAVIRSVMADILVEYSRQNEERLTDAPPLWLTRACDAMCQPENLQEGLRKFIALSGRTQEHVTRTLKKTMGKTPTEFINGLRIRWIEQRLSSGDHPIIQTALEAGFNNIPHFNTLFKKTFGAPPREYLKKQNHGIVP